MPDTVFDSHALLAYLRGETPAVVVREMMADAAEAGTCIWMNEVNYAEVKYTILRKDGAAAWNKALGILETLPVVILPATRELADLAGDYKAAHKMSLADAFAAALAKERDATLVTGDPEFKPLAKDIRIKWLKS